MTKKSFDTQSITDKFFTQVTDQEATTPAQDQKPKTDKPSRTYRYNLALDSDLNDFLHDIAWKKRMSMTQYINDLIRADKEKSESEGD